MRVLARITSDLDELARRDPKAEVLEEREALRKAFGLPHDSGDYAEYFRHIRGQ